MRIVLIIVLALHGIIHFMGFVKAYRLATIDQLTIPISKSRGLVWLLAGLMMLVAAILFLADVYWWWAPAALAAVLSQYLIIRSWEDAKWGTVANIIILLAVILSLSSISFQQEYFI